MFLSQKSSRLAQICLVTLLLAQLYGVPLPAWGQDSAADESAAIERERVMADRFLQVLQRRPRPGTSLDRVYGFHVQNGSLDEFIDSLDVPDDAEDAGQQRMILGLLQTQRGQQALAAEAFAKAEQLLPDDFAASYYLGRSLLAIGQTEKAAAAIQRAVDRKPPRNEALPVFTELGRIYGRAGQAEKALAVWKQLESLFPGDSRVGGQIATTLAEEGNLDEALRRFEALATTARKDDEKIAFAVQAAEMQRRLGQTEQATAALEKILSRLRPGSWLYSDVRNRIEDGFLKSGDYDALADYYKQKLADSPDDLALQVRLGRILVSARRLDEAAKTLQGAVEKAPDDPEVRLALVDVLVSKGEMAGAAEQYKQLAANDPSNPDYLLRWGQILLEDEKQPLENRRQAAVDIWKRLAKNRSEDAVTLSQIADRMRGIDRKEDAIALYRQAIDVDPESPQYREYLGEYLHQLDRKDDAIEVWRSMAEGDRRSRDSLVRLAEVFGTFDENQMALQAWKDASELDLTFAQELRYAKVLREAKQFDQAFVRLDAAGSIAETPDEQEQLLKDRIVTYQQAGTLAEQIAARQAAEPTTENLRQLAMMHSAAGQLTEAAESIAKAQQLSPEDVDVLIIAAEIQERQNRFADAAETFEKLAAVDTRFRTNYLERVADLQMRLGQVDEALLTCDSLIDANPASPESYQFLARLAFRAGRDDQGFTALRRAMNVAPRDNGPRKMLASTFADRYRTEEAIELYWQAMRYENETDGRIGMIKRLAPLYERKAEIDELIRRIDEMGREDVDTRTTQLMTAAAYEAVQDYGAARSAIDRLLANQPRDVTLLESMVRLSDLSDEVLLAAEFQERIVGLADTPENRFKLVQLQLDADLIDIKTALNQRIALASDPQRLGLMIRSATARGDHEAGIAICEEVLRRDPSLWDIKLTLAELLLYQTETDSEAETDGEPAAKDDNPIPAPHRRAMELADEVRSMDVALDALPPTAKKPTVSSTSSNSRPPNYYTSPRYWSVSGYELARNYRVGRYASANYGYSSSQGGLIQPRSFGHARVIAVALDMVAICKAYSQDEANEKIQTVIEQKAKLPEVDQIQDANQIWEYRALQSTASSLAQYGTNNTVSQQNREQNEQLNWRLAELDPENGSASLKSMLMQKVRKAAVAKSDPPPSDDKADDEKSSDDDAMTLTDDQVKLLLSLYEQAEVDAKADKSQRNAASWSNLTTYRAILGHHFQSTGQTERAAEFELVPPGEDASLRELVSAISFYLSLNQIEQCDALVPRLLPAVRSDTDGNAAVSNSASGMAGGWLRTGKQGESFVEQHRFAILDAVLAEAIRASANPKSRSGGLSDGTLNTYVQNENGSFYSVTVKAPLSSDLLTRQVVTELSSLMPVASGTRSPRELSIPDDVIAHLDQPLEGAPAYEQKTRAILAAFAYWWNKLPQKTYQRINQLCELYPDDVDLKIEQARLASELAQPRVALEKLDSFDPLDSRMLVRKEMAAMNLASQIGDVERAKQAAERLFGLRMDTATQLALADQLRRLGMNSKSAAVLRRLRGGRARDERTDLQIAQSFMSAEDKEAAAEVAYTVLRRLNSGRGSASNSDYYRRQAVSILRSAGRLDPLIERAKRRIESSPSSVRARIELAELYTAAGQQEDAEQLWQVIAKSKPNDPRQLIARATALNKANKYDEAAVMYLDAFAQDPQLFNQHFYEMTRAVQQSKDSDAMFERLVKISPDAIPGYRMDELFRIGSQTDYSDAKRKFVKHALKNTQLQQDYYRYIDDIPAAERKKIPEIRKLILDAICSNDAFSKTSRLWNVTSYSSNGTAMGPLKGTLELLKTDTKGRERFLKAVERVKEKKELAQTATFLTAMMDVSDDEKRPAAVERIRELLPSANEASTQESSDSDTVQISSGLLWQGGQILEEIRTIDDRYPLLVSIYRTSQQSEGQTNNNLQYTVGYRLVQALSNNDQKSEARAFLMDQYNQNDHSADNQYNPGYGDYQEIQVSQSIAAMLDEMGFHIDSLLILQRLAADPGKFAKAKRWGGQRMTPAETIKKIEQVAKKIDSKSSAEYIKILAAHVASSDDNPAIKLLEIPVEMLFDSQTEPGIEMALRSAAETESGRESLQTFAQQLQTESEKRSDDWSIPATQILLAMHTEQGDLAALAKELKTRLPDVSKIAAADVAAAEMYRPLTGLFTTASVAANSDLEAAKAIAQDLASYLQAVAKSLNDPALDLAAASLSNQGGESLQAFLDRIEKLITPDALLPAAQIDACLHIAGIAAQNGQLAVSTRALKLALQNGPPLRQISTGGDAFAINQNRSSSPADMDDGLEELTEDVLKIINDYSNAIGQKLGANEPTPPQDTPDAAPKATVDQETLLQIQDSLAAIVMPANQPTSVYPYAKQIVSRQNYDNFSNATQFEIESASVALGRIAALAGGSDEVIDALRSRLESAADKATVAGALVDVALAANQPAAIESAVEQFATALDGVLPADEGPETTPESLQSITSQMQQDSYRKSETIDLVVRTIWPLVESDDESLKPAQNRAITILSRTGRLIQTDSYTANRHREVLSRIRNRRLKSAATNGNQDIFKSLISTELESIKQQYMSYDSEHRDRYSRQARERLLTQLITDGLMENSTGFLRKMMLEEERPSYESNVQGLVCLETAKLSPQERFDYLKRLTLGESADDPIAHWSRLVRYSDVPAMVSRQVPRLTEIQSLPTCSAAVPVADTILMLADVAAELGETETLAKFFSDRSTGKGDEADVVASIVRLAAIEGKESGLKWLYPTLGALAKHLAATKPDKQDPKLVFPDLALFLAARAVDAGIPKANVNWLLQELRMHALRGQYNEMASLVSRVRAAAEIGNLAGASSDSPLRHFLSVSIPSRLKPDSANLAPLYAINSEGVITGTSGDDTSLLMFRYPVTGDFTFSIQTGEKGNSDVDVSYGGVMYSALGWTQKAKLNALGSNYNSEFPLSNIKRGESNLESLQISPQQTEASCNGVVYATDKTVGSFPWVAVAYLAQHTVEVRELILKGELTIPDELNLIDPTMRGWASFSYSNAAIDPLLPIGPKQENAEQVKANREKHLQQAAEGSLNNAWYVKDGELIYRHSQSSNHYDSGTQLQYLRPLLDGESIELSFWWDDTSAIHPTLGRTVLELSELGMTPIWSVLPNDMASVGYVAATQLEPPVTPIATDNVPIVDAWNLIRMTRNGDQVVVTLNDNPLTEIPVTESARPGFSRKQNQSAKIRWIKLTGDWPSELPNDLLAR
ncbi:tetratricopeptide repeat protein [Stieleria sp. TO1_6]|uniref:tetratricopeptide repeat protein n=1 Tax=Stieleria tagensis TaxID=2956795 RepID=UPI00209AE7AF|nr:tetratricopeptide repeat protein [Stieleria tagensis]MCO8124513.1 tetratricopeptide repeat protein [Stieleria tagensis]